MLIAIVLENERVGVPLDTEFDHSLTVKSVEEYETVLLAGRNKFKPKKKHPKKCSQRQILPTIPTGSILVRTLRKTQYRDIRYFRVFLRSRFEI